MRVSIMNRLVFKGTRLRKTSSAEKVPQTLRSNEFMEYFPFLVARFLVEKVSSPTLSKVTLVFIPVDPVFFIDPFF